MSHTVGTTQVEEDISKNAEKIADTVMTEKFEDMEDPPHPDLEEEEWIYAPEKSTNMVSELLEPEQSKDEEAVKWYNVRFRPSMNFEQQSLLLMDKVTCEGRGYLINIEDRCIMEVRMTKEDADRIEGLDEVVSVEPFLGVHKFTLSSPPGPVVDYSYDPFGY
ncbi:hypothetical protein HRI_005226500 [Hibiscus trionum]|uniref:Uncharacterized protein n=1 Tax=Hibiscus trionum TaxID=183268 RepID=A0A9W7JJ32_HIBTR|nr:hypothetical protein HRI_005226500 [Hibiscus trionum]